MRLVVYVELQKLILKSLAVFSREIRGNGAA